MTPSDVKVGEYYFVHPFRKHEYAGRKFQVTRIFGTCFLADEEFEIFFYDMWR